MRHLFFKKIIFSSFFRFFLRHGIIFFFWILSSPKDFRDDLKKAFHQVSSVDNLRFIYFLFSLRFPNKFNRDIYYFPANFKLRRIDWLEEVFLSKKQTFEILSKRVMLLYLQASDYEDERGALFLELKSAMQELLDSSFSASGEIYPHPIFKQEAKYFTVEDARKVLFDLDDALGSLSKPWYIISGTFLGCVRERAFLGHDYDIDIGISDIAMEELLEQIKESTNFVVHQIRILPLEVADQYGLSEKRCLVVVRHHTGIDVDIFAHYEIGGQLIHLTPIHQWSNTLFQLGNYEFYSLRVNGPDHFERYLVENYGDNWRVPIKDFNSTLGTPNGCATPSIQALIFFLKKIVQLRYYGYDDTSLSYRKFLVDSGLLVLKEGRYFLNFHTFPLFRMST